jgi:hypothetical protein
VKQLINFLIAQRFVVHADSTDIPVGEILSVASSSVCANTEVIRSRQLRIAGTARFDELAIEVEVGTLAITPRSAVMLELVELDTECGCNDFSISGNFNRGLCR